MSCDRELTPREVANFNFTATDVKNMWYPQSSENVHARAGKGVKSTFVGITIIASYNVVIKEVAIETGPLIASIVLSCSNVTKTITYKCSKVKTDQKQINTGVEEAVSTKLTSSISSKIASSIGAKQAIPGAAEATESISSEIASSIASEIAESVKQNFNAATLSQIVSTEEMTVTQTYGPPAFKCFSETIDIHEMNKVLSVELYLTGVKVIIGVKQSEGTDGTPQGIKYNYWWGKDTIAKIFTFMKNEDPKLIASGKLLLPMGEPCVQTLREFSQECCPGISEEDAYKMSGIDIPKKKDPKPEPKSEKLYFKYPTIENGTEEFYKEVEKDLQNLVNPKTDDKGFIMNNETAYRNLEKIIAKRLKTGTTPLIFVEESSTIMHGPAEGPPEEIY